MTRLELIKILVGQAHANGFEFRRWFTTRLTLPWDGADHAIRLLETHRRYYALLFSHDFAKTFWKAGSPITFQVPAQTFQRRMADGSIGTVERRSFTRRARPDAWRYHLREMALAEEPLRYMRKYLRVEEEVTDLDQETVATKPATRRAPPAIPLPPTLAFARKAHERRQKSLATVKELPTEVPAAPESTTKRGARVPGSRAKSR